jgi:hypothetical protein
MNSLKKGSGKQSSRSGSQDKIPDSESRKNRKGGTRWFHSSGFMMYDGCIFV